MLDRGRVFGPCLYFLKVGEKGLPAIVGWLWGDGKISLTSPAGLDKKNHVKIIEH
jgi:hypothetical protein